MSDHPTPSDAARTGAKLAARRRAIAAWNDQMHAVVDVILHADDIGRGVIIQVSRTNNRVDARASVHVAAGRAAIFDHDRPGTTFVTRPIRTEHLRSTR